MDASQIASQVGAGALVVGLGAAAVADWREREVSDTLWLALAVLGLVIGLAAVSPGLVALAAWLLVAAFVLEHMVPWDQWLGGWQEHAGEVEIVVYILVGALLAALLWSFGIGPGKVPPAALAVYVSVLFARGLFEGRILYGGADAKALMVAALLVPLYAQPLVPLPANATMALSVFPFALTLLLNAAVLAIGIPIILFVRNALRGDLEFPRAFTSFRIDVTELPDRFVWVRDPTFHADPEEEEVETSEDDRRLRERQRDRLLAQGVHRIWVTPQIPFVVLMAGGAIVGLLVGSLAFDLFALL